MKKLWNWMKEHKLITVAVTGTLLLFIGTFTLCAIMNKKPETLYEQQPYTYFQAQLNKELVKSIEYGYGEKMRVTGFDGVTYETAYPAGENFRKEMLEKGVELKIVSSGNNSQLVSEIVSCVISVGFMVVMIVMLKKMMGAGTNFTEKTLVQTSTVKFSDVIGHNEIVGDVMFAADLLKNPDKGNELGASAPKGILLEGPPGTGKTLVAKAIAGEAGVPFISVSGSTFIEKYVGVGAQRVRQVFKIARQNAPCVVFIDEIDAVGMQRGRGGCQEYEQTINQLLTEMDGFSGKSGILVLAATNRADMLDEALCRSGRFDRRITINRPKDWKVRAELFNHYLKDKKLSDDVSIEGIARQTANYSGADIAAACNEASNIALQRGLKFITMDCLEEAIDKKVFNGNRVKNSDERRKDKEIVAYHESGHAVVTWLLGKPIARATIIGTTSGVGGAVFREDEDSQFMTKKDIIDFVMIAYGGRASEEIHFGQENITTGASSDISQATKLLSGAVMRYGFYSTDCGLVDINALKDAGINSSENDALKIIQKETSELYQQTVALLKSNYHLVEKLAEKLLEVETMSGDEVEDLLQAQK